MSKSVDDIQAEGDLSKRVAHSGPHDEVGRLAEAFNRMMTSLEAAFLAHRRFLSNASHELRTPLTVVRGQVELLEQENLSDQAMRSQTVALEELDRTNR